MVHKTKGVGQAQKGSSIGMFNHQTRRRKATEPQILLWPILNYQVLLIRLFSQLSFRLEMDGTRRILRALLRHFLLSVHKNSCDERAVLGTQLLYCHLVSPKKKKKFMGCGRSARNNIYLPHRFLPSQVFFVLVAYSVHVLSS